MTNELKHIKSARAAIGEHLLEIYNAKIDRDIQRTRSYIKDIETLLSRKSKEGYQSDRQLPNDGSATIS